MVQDMDPDTGLPITVGCDEAKLMEGADGAPGGNDKRQMVRVCVSAGLINPSYGDCVTADPVDQHAGPHAVQPHPLPRVRRLTKQQQQQLTALLFLQQQWQRHAPAASRGSAVRRGERARAGGHHPAQEPAEAGGAAGRPAEQTRGRHSGHIFRRCICQQPGDLFPEQIPEKEQQQPSDQ